MVFFPASVLNTKLAAVMFGSGKSTSVKLAGKCQLEAKSSSSVEWKPERTKRDKKDNK